MGDENTQSRSRRKRYEPPVIWLWFAGRDLDEENGKGRTDATWTHAATKVFYPYSGAPASRWSKMAHWKRSAIRQGTVLGGVLVGWDYYHHAAVTILGLSLLTVIIAGHHIHQGTRRFFPLKHYWQWVRPFSHTLQAELGIVPQRLAITAHPDTRLPTGVTIELPDEYLGSDHERAAVTTAVEQILAIEAPEASWNLVGRNHTVHFTHSDPPPPHLWWNEIAAEVKSAKYHELVCGIGKRDCIVKASHESDSPMFGIGMGSGGGKTNTAAFWLVQRLIRGDMGYIIDGKRFSHPYAFKDMDAERDQLPNIGYARRPEDMHHALVTLGQELHGRNERAEDVINAKGHLLGGVGPRLWVVLEELNMVVPMLQDYWAIERERVAKEEGIKLPKSSPALRAMSALAFAGRQVGIHLIFIGQRLDADVLGTSGSKGGSVRGNIGVRCLARYDEQSWAIQAGKGCPMPPSPSVPGRVQMWLGGDVHETQIPEMDYEQVRELAVSGTVTQLPAHWPGVAQGSRLALPPVPVLGEVNGHTPPDQALSHKTPVRPPGLVTLSEAVAQGVFGQRSLQTVRRASTRPGFAEPVDQEDKAFLYRLADLYAMERKKELTR